MRFLHTMIRVSSLTDTLHFFCDLLGCQEIKRTENSTGRYTLVYLAAPEDLDTAEQYAAPLIELTYNWDENSYSGGRNFGHIAFSVNNIYDICDRLKKAGVMINRPPRDGYMAFIRTPDGISIELLQKGAPLLPQEPWISQDNIGQW